MKSNKGQFFLIGAVVITSILFTVYNVFLGYFAIDTSEIQLREEAPIAQNIENISRDLFHKLNSSEISCDEYTRNINSFDVFVEKHVPERGIFIDYIADIENGCIWTDFEMLMDSESVTLSKNWRMNTSFESFNFTLDSQDEWDGNGPWTIEDSFNIESHSDEGGKINLTSGAEGGIIVYQFDACKEATSGCENAVWYNHSHDSVEPGNSESTFRFATNETGEFEFKDNIDETERSRYLKLEINLNRTDTSNDVRVRESELKFATTE